MKIFINRYDELHSGWSVAALFVVTILGMGVGSQMIPEDGAEPGLLMKIAVTIVYCLITIGGAILLFKIIYRRRLCQMGFASKGWLIELLYGILLGAVSIGLIFGVLILTGQAEVTGVATEKILSLTIIVEFFSVGMMAFSEEVLMRGYLMTALKPTRNKWVIFLAPAVLFSLLHLMNPGFTFLSLLNTFLAGMLFAAMFIKSGKLWLPSDFHIAWNFFQGDILGMTVSGNAQAAIVSTKMGTNEWMTGGNYGPEGGILVTCILLLGLLFLKFIYKKPVDTAWTEESDLPFTRGKIRSDESR